MSASFEIYPARTGGAAENMALDFLLLQRHPRPEVARFRHYGWRRPAFTFGYSQKLAAVRPLMAAEDSPEICRRPTGGGVVDHRDDWTYALVLPRGHALEEMRAAESYRLVHEALVAALGRQNVAATLQRPGATVAAGIAGACFVQAEPFDVIHERSRAKIAGAAQKRNKRGLLLQGSIARAACGRGVDWDAFPEAFAAELAKVLAAPPTPTPFPEFADGEVEALTEQYGGREWNEAR